MGEISNTVDLPVGQSEATGVVLSTFEVTPILLNKMQQYVNESKNYYESQRTIWADELKKYDRAYRAETEIDRKYQGFSDVASPLVHDNVQTLVSRITEAILLKNDDLIDIESKTLPRQLLEYRRNEILEQMSKQNIEDKVRSLVEIVTKFGTGFIKCTLQNEENQILTRQLVAKKVPKLDFSGKQMIDDFGQPMFDIIQQLEIVPKIDKKYFGPGYEIITDPEDVYLDMTIEKMEDQPIVIHRCIVGEEHLKRGMQLGVYLPDQVEKIIDKPYEKNTYTSTRKEEMLQTTQIMNNTTNKKYAERQYELMQAWCNLSVELGTDQNTGQSITKVFKVQACVIGNTCISLMQNPFYHQQCPIIKVVYRKIPGEAYGIGAIQPIIDLYHEYVDLNNQKNDGRVLAINPMFVQVSNSITDKQDLQISPGFVMNVRQQGDISILPMDMSFLVTAEQNLEILEQRINRGMGITPLYIGQSDKTDLDKTWRGTNKLITQADKKMRYICKDIESTAIQQWAEMAYKINIQFLPTQYDNVFEIANSETSIIVKGVESYFDKQEDLEKHMQIFGLFAQIPGFNIYGLAQKIADMMAIDLSDSGGLFLPQQSESEKQEPPKVNVGIQIDPSKGVWNKYAAAQLLAGKGVVLDLDAIRQAQEYERDDDQQVKTESGNLPPRQDSYSKNDIRSIKNGQRKN